MNLSFTLSQDSFDKYRVLFFSVDNDINMLRADVIMYVTFIHNFYTGYTILTVDNRTLVLSLFL